MIRSFIFVSIISFFFQTSLAGTDLTMPPQKPKAQASMPPKPNSIGEYGDVQFKPQDAKPIPTTFSEDEIVIKTAVTEVCPKKGCWMKVKGATADEQVRVTFKDYGFFVPTDLVGKEVALQGHYVEHTESIEEQKHLLQDAKRPQAEIDAITQPKTTLRFVATGVKDLSAKPNK